MRPLATLIVLVTWAAGGFAGFLASVFIEPHAFGGRDGEGAAGEAVFLLLASLAVLVMGTLVNGLLLRYLRKKDEVSRSMALGGTFLPVLTATLSFSVLAGIGAVTRSRASAQARAEAARDRAIYDSNLQEFMRAIRTRQFDRLRARGSDACAGHDASRSACRALEDAFGAVLASRDREAARALLSFHFRGDEFPPLYQAHQRHEDWFFKLVAEDDFYSADLSAYLARIAVEEGVAPLEALWQAGVPLDLRADPRFRTSSEAPGRKYREDEPHSTLIQWVARAASRRCENDERVDPRIIPFLKKHGAELNRWGKDPSLPSDLSPLDLFVEEASFLRRDNPPACAGQLISAFRGAGARLHFRESEIRSMLARQQKDIDEQKARHANGDAYEARYLESLMEKARLLRAMLE